MRVRPGVVVVVVVVRSAPDLALTLIDEIAKRRRVRVSELRVARLGAQSRCIIGIRSSACTVEKQSSWSIRR